MIRTNAGWWAMALTFVTVVLSLEYALPVWPHTVALLVALGLLVTGVRRFLGWLVAKGHRLQVEREAFTETES